MKTFNQHYLEERELQESGEILLEKLITFGGKAYPNFGNVVIMAGGAGSGKGFVLSNLVGLEGKVMDVDALKTAAAKSKLIQKRVKDKTGMDIAAIASDLKNSENVGKLHDIIANVLQIDARKQKVLMTGILAAPADRKPNLIFDTTLKDITKLGNLSRQLTNVGYDKKNIHIVWVVNDIEVAKAQNLTRSRTVPAEILVNTHRGASQTMGDILNMGKTLKRYMDGDIVFAFNKVGVDSQLKVSGGGGSFLEDAKYFYVKRQGKPPTPVANLEKDIKAKISSYVPKAVTWA
ncbi:MAG: hypothetical protein CMA07_06975 [Euryarchaeota archaeon]|nr:hypothetical protein [Euryarchaeota archaeon]